MSRIFFNIREEENKPSDFFLTESFVKPKAVAARIIDNEGL